MLQLANKKVLETLKLSYCPLGNLGFEAILASCPGLRRVTVEGCWLSTMCVFRAVRRFPNLKLWAKGETSTAYNTSLHCKPLACE